MHDLYLAANADVSPSGALSGFVATVDGRAPAASLVDAEQGSGSTWMRLDEATFDEAALVRAQAALSAVQSRDARHGEMR